MNQPWQKIYQNISYRSCKRNLKYFMYCNGARLNGQFMKDVINAGIDFFKI